MTFWGMNLISILWWIYSVSGLYTSEKGQHCYDVTEDLSAVYTGNVANTIHGIECQRWEWQYPHRHRFTRDDMFPDKSVSEALNYCRDPGKFGFPWCFTNKPSIKWDRCGISPCQGVQCYYAMKNHAFYTGKKNVNKESVCQRWDSQSPHKHNFTNPGLFNAKRLSDVANYCRDPDGTGVPWCFSDHPKKGRLSCVIARCKDCFIIKNRHALYYGTKHVSSSGLKCQAWDSMTGVSYLFSDDSFPDHSRSRAENFCRDPDGTGEPWCYTGNVIPSRETCGVMPCPETDCYTKMNNTILYQGSTSTTVLGYRCQRWSWDIPQVNYYKERSNYPENSILKSSNYCRDPSNEGFLWCYTTDPKKRWDKCAVPACIDLECYFKVENRIVYVGSINTSKNGYICQEWFKYYPHKHDYIQAASVSTDRKGLVKNFCRDPSHDGYLWCYTTNPSVRWDKCDVPAC